MSERQLTEADLDTIQRNVHAFRDAAFAVAAVGDKPGPPTIEMALRMGFIGGWVNCRMLPGNFVWFLDLNLMAEMEALREALAKFEAAMADV